MGTAVLAGGAPTLVGVATYRYGFTGSFVEGTVDVEFVAGTFADRASTPNVNVSETESFTVTLPPPVPTTVDNGDAGFASSGWTLYNGDGYQSDFHYTAAGSGSKVATWTFTGLPAGAYEVSATWSPHANRVSNAPFAILDDTALVGRRWVVYDALRSGAYHAWDFQPHQDASERYMRNHMDLNVLEENQRYPRGE